MIPDVLSRRAYFAAHAPAEPQPWFDPVMPPAPSVPSVATVREGWTQRQRDDWRGLDDYLDDHEVDSAVLEFRDQQREAENALAAWRVEQARQRLVQWPWAWADAILKAERPPVIQNIVFASPVVQPLHGEPPPGGTPEPPASAVGVHLPGSAQEGGDGGGS